MRRCGLDAMNIDDLESEVLAWLRLQELREAVRVLCRAAPVAGLAHVRRKAKLSGSM